VITPGTLTALGVPLRAGRDFHDGDTYDASFTALINEALARQSFPGQDPIGHLIYCGLDSLKPMKIVGVVSDFRQLGPARDPRPEILMPYQQHPFPATALNLVVRTAHPPGAVSGAVRAKVRALSADVPVKFTTMEAALSENVAAPRFRTLLLSLFAALAVCLAMAGVYGVMACVVGQRTAEIGLRMALGARPSEVLRLVLGQGTRLASAGLVLGLLGAAALTRLLTAMLFGVQPNDPATFASVSAGLIGVAIAACSVPAWRASRVDPVIALRQE
jgi:predicted permease